VLTVQGRRQWRKVPGARNKGDAERYRTKLLADMDKGDLVVPKRVTVAQFVERWRESAYPSIAPNTRDAYTSAINALVNHLGARQLSGLDREDIDRWRAAMQQTMKDSTVKAYMVVAQTVMKAAVEWRYISRSPLDGVKRPRGQRTKIQPLTPEEMRRLLAAADLQWKAILLMTVTGGLRLGEVCAARWEHLNAAEGTYTVSGTVVQMAGYSAVAGTKTARSASQVCLSPATIAALQRHRQAQAEHALAKGLAGSEWIFLNNRGARWALCSLRRWWTQLQMDAGVESRRYHDLRHTCAAWMIDSGAHPKTIQEQMRHATIQTTLDTYGHLMPQRSGEAVARLDAVMEAR